MCGITAGHGVLAPGIRPAKRRKQRDRRSQIILANTKILIWKKRKKCVYKCLQMSEHFFTDDLYMRVLVNFF